ncbi:MAG: NAD-dependent epimerase/dehydratase family protein [Euryarchaeota archaeon]|nr:NAD-dependent epimerase/dehydratase family protein [Euryarchaeota archaeon]
MTGCAGFIGSHLTERLLRQGNSVVGIDDLSAGRREFLRFLEKYGSFEFVEGDILKLDLGRIMAKANVVCHFAANPDVRVGASDTKVHFEQNILATYLVLEGVRESGTGHLLFPSTSTVYGEPTAIPTPETYGPLIPISMYGASKLACEALVAAYCSNYDLSAVIYRFANVVGARSTHNVLHDFVRKLRKNPRELEILGAAPGTRKSYVHIADCVDAMIVGAERAKEQVEILNIGSRDRITVKEIADIVVESMGLKDVDYRWTGGVKGGRGWVGDVKEMLLSTDRIEGLGWRPRHGSAEAVRKAVEDIIGER